MLAAGRGFVQTYMPEHPVIQAIITGDRDAFLDTEIRQRQAGMLPPYGRLAAKYDIPVIFHTGDTYSQSAKVKYAHPLFIDDVAVDFPETPLLWYALAALAKDDLAVKAWDDLDKPGVKIAVPQASSMDRFVSEHAAKADIQRFPDNAAAIAAFQSGRVDSVVLFHPPLLAARQKLGKGKIVVPTPAQWQASSTALRKGDNEFVAWVDAQIGAYYKSGQTQKWYEAALTDFGLDPKLAPPVMKEMIK